MKISRTKGWVTLLAVAAAITTLSASSLTANASSGVKPGVSHAKPDLSILAKEKAASANVVTSAASVAALASIQKRISLYVARNGTKYSFASYGDHRSGNIVVNTDAPAAVVSSLTSLSGKLAGVQVQIRRQGVADTFTRRDDVPAFYGGGGLLASGSLCSTGYAVKDALGNRFMVSAGHCYANGTVVSTESGLNIEGTVQNRLLASLGNGPVDMELLGTQSYAGRIFTGGVLSSTSIPVVGAGSASVGYNDYCHSGRTTGENCGHTATSITGQVCTATGCKSPVIVFTGGTLSAGGDSGGTFYAKNASGAFIRGHVIAGGAGTSYAETFLKVQARYGVSIVLG